MSHWIRYLAAGAAIVIIAAATALGIYTHSNAFRELVRQKLVAGVNESIRGKITVARIEGSMWGNLALVDVRVLYDGAEIARIPRLGIYHSLLPLLWKRVQVFQLTADHPWLRLQEEEAGTWNIVKAFLPAQPSPSQSSNWTIWLNSLQLQKANVVVSTREKKLYRVDDLNLRGNLGLGISGMSLNISQLSCGVEMEGTPQARVEGSLTYQTNANSAASLEARDVSVASGNSKVSVTGKIKDMQTLDTSAAISITQLSSADAVRYLPQWPVLSPIKGIINIRGPISALDGDFSLATADGQIGGKFKAALAGDRPHYQGEVVASRIDLYKLLGGDKTVGIISAKLTANGAGLELNDITAQGEARIESAAVAAWKIGNVFVQGKLANRVAVISGQIKSELGHADWKGQIALDKPPRYDLSLAAEQLDIEKLSPQGKPIAGKLNLRAIVNGSGVGLAEMKARTEINLLPSSIADVQIDRGRLVAAIAGKRIRISEAFMKAGSATLNASGDVGTDVKQQGQLNYRLQIGALSPWLNLVGQKGSGSLNASGRARGSLSDLKSEGTLGAKSIRYGGTAIQSVSANYSLNYLSQRSNLLEGRINFDLADLESGYHLQRLAGVVNILPKVPYTFGLQARALDDQSRNHTMAATIQYQPGNIVARVSELTLSLPDGAWRLAQPATIAQRQRDFVVDRLTMRNNDRRLFVDGRFSLSGNQSLQLTIDRLPIESLRSFYPMKVDITGLLSAQGRLSGTAAAPRIEATVKLENSKIAGQSYAGLSGSTSYSGRTAEVKATVQQDQRHQLTAEGSVPVTISWLNGWRAQSSGVLSGRIQSSGVSIRFLNAFSGRAVQGIDGEIALNVRLRGTLERPLADGFVRLRDGKFAPSALGIQVRSVTLDGELEPRGFRIRQLSAHAGDGQLNGSGMIGLNNFAPQSIDVNLAAKNWPAINTQQYRAVTNASVNLNGTLKAPRISGKLDVIQGEVRPDLAFLEHGSTPVKRDPTITVVSAANGESSPNQNSKKGSDAADSELVRNTSLLIQVHIPNNFWVKHRNANLELSGNIQAAQTPGGKPTITGVIETLRGWVGFQGRRFTVTRGRVEFTGSGKINPTLDVNAEYRVTNYLVNAVVSGTVEKPALKLVSEPQLDQADILALLLFNKPMSALGKGEQVSLQQNAVSLTSGFAASTIGAAVSKALGLQDLGVDLADVDFSGGQVRYGRYLSRNTFVSVGQDVTGKTGQEAAAEYQITRDWKLDVTTSTKGSRGVDIIWHKRY